MRYAQLTLFTLLFFLPSRLVHAATADTTCGIIWDEPILLSDTSYNTSSPEIVLCGDDTVHITWFSIARFGTSDLRLPYCRSTDGGTTMEGPRELLTDSISFPGYANRPLIVAWNSNVYVFFQGATGTYSPIRMVKSMDGGSTWQGPVDISPDSAGPPPLTATIIGDTIAMTYVPFGQVTHNILRSTDGGDNWVSVNAGLPNFSNLALGTRVDQSLGAVLHLAQMGSNETEYRRSHDLGDTWVQQLLLSPPDGLQSSDPIVAAGTTPSDTAVLAAWRDPKYGCMGVFGCSIIGRIATAGDSTTTWGPESTYTDQPRGFEPSLATFKGRHAIAWRDEVDPGTTFHAAVRVSHADGVTWCPVYDLTPTTLFKVINVEVALSSKAVHIVWNQNIAPDPSKFRIFYRRGRFITTDVEEKSHEMPAVSLLQQNYPNPFNPSTSIRYEVPKSGLVELRVFDVLGREVAILVNETKEPGEHTVEWRADGLSSGVYHYRLMAGEKIETKKAILIR